MLLVSVETVKAPETNCAAKHKRRLRNKREAGANTALRLPELVNIPEKATAWPCGVQILPLLSLSCRRAASSLSTYGMWSCQLVLVRVFISYLTGC